MKLRNAFLVLFATLFLSFQAGATQSVISDPSAGSCTDPAPANTGNGTCAVSVLTGYVKSETFTFTRSSGAGANQTWTVSGSVSGSLSNTTTGGAHVINNTAGLPLFTLNLSDGGTPYAGADNFQVIITSGTALKKSTFDSLYAFWTNSTSNTGTASLKGTGLNISPAAAADAFLAMNSNTGKAEIDWNGQASGSHSTQGSNRCFYNDLSTNKEIAQINFLNNTSATAANAGGEVVIKTLKNGGSLTQALFLDQNQNMTVGSTNALSHTFIAAPSGYTGTVIPGTQTNNNASAGQVGEYIESVISTLTNWPVASNTWGNLTSISLTVGDWDVTFGMNEETNGATVSSVHQATYVAISVNSGATISDQIVGSNQFALVAPGSTSDRSCYVPAYRISLSGPATVYGKAIETYSVATPQYQCRLSARRVR